MKLYDHLLLPGLVGSISYIFLFQWMPESPYGSFSMLGAAFLISLTIMMIKVFIASTTLGIEWLLPRISKRFGNIKIKQPSFSIFNKRIEIRIVDKNNLNGKVTF